MWPMNWYNKAKKCASPSQAIDRLPLVPGVLELVGIGYTGVS